MVQKTKERRARSQVPEGELRLKYVRLADAAVKADMRLTRLPAHARLNTHAEFNLSPNKDLIVVTVAFKLDAVDQPTVDSPALISIHATYWALYKVVGIFATEQAMIEKINVLVLNDVWPYWKEYAHSMAFRMGVPTIPMDAPVLTKIVRA